MGQLSLFEDLPISPAPPDPESEAARELREASDLCLLFTSGERSGFSGYHFMMSLADAKKWCSDSRTKGTMHGGKWAYFFFHIFTVFDNGDNRLIIGKNVTDNGKYEALLDELCCTVIPFNEWQKILKPMGFTVEYQMQEAENE